MQYTITYFFEKQLCVLQDILYFMSKYDRIKYKISRKLLISYTINFFSNSNFNNFTLIFLRRRFQLWIEF